MNIPLLRAIAQKAIDFPETSRMQLFGEITPKDAAHPCGAVACIAGTAVLIQSRRKFLALCRKDTCFWTVEDSLFFKAGAKALDLTENQAMRLFAPDGWPAKLWDAYETAATPKQGARVLHRRIERFIKTEGRE